MTINEAGSVGAITTALMLGGCGNGAQDVLALKIELTALKQELEFVRLQTEELDPRVRMAEQMAMQVFDERDAPVRLDCAHLSPAVLFTRLASITAACEEAVGHAGGYRLRLRLGNPMSARIDGLSLTFYAGADAERGRSARRLHHDANLSLSPGEWKLIDIDLAGLDDESVRDLAVKANVAAIALAGK
jgi:hypothetical protein